ncbi:septum formation initiator family protein [Candidatus Uhrbacteria bacterium]|nr:septum formation initiator family protein [Candidatus Uhrbacteria bacterium]
MRRTTGEDNPFWKKLIRWPAFLVANLALFLLIGVSTVRETYRGYTVDREIKALEAQAEALEGQKMKLTQLTQAAASPEKTELEARSRLGWKKDGEKVFVLTGYQPADKPAEASVFAAPQVLPPSNPELWFAYFFKPEK